MTASKLTIRPSLLNVQQAETELEEDYINILLQIFANKKLQSSVPVAIAAMDFGHVSKQL